MRTGHKPVTLNYFRMLSSFKRPKDRRLAEDLLIRSRKPVISVKEATVPLKLF